MVGTASLSKFATRARREGGVEPPQPGLRSPGRHRDFASREVDGHEGSAPSTPVWKTGVCLSTPMLNENAVPYESCSYQDGFEAARPTGSKL